MILVEVSTLDVPILPVYSCWKTGIHFLGHIRPIPSCNITYFSVFGAMRILHFIELSFQSAGSGYSGGFFSQFLRNVILVVIKRVSLELD